MDAKYKCELCGNWHEKVMIMELRVNNQPAMVRAYCSGCWPKTQFPVEAFLKRTARLVEPVGDSSPESAPAA